MERQLCVYFFLIIVLLSCHNEQSKKVIDSNHEIASTIVVLPLGSDFPRKITFEVSKKIESYVGSAKVITSAALPHSAFYSPRGRYRADSLLNFLKGGVGKNQVVVGLTKKDISTTKGSYPDWGVMGLAFRPGNAAIVSNYRLKNKDMLWKVVIHELGHTAGLSHCKVLTCLMRDADGGDPTREENGFCSSCKDFLLQKGWVLKGCVK